MIRALFASLFVCYVLMSAYFSFKKPIYDWDMLAYAAICHQHSGEDENNTHEYIYDTLLNLLPPGTHSIVVQKPNEVSCAHNSYFFSQQIPFYTIKPVYNLLIKGLTHFVESPVKAMSLISVFCYIFICLLLWFWLSLYLEYIWACVAAICISSLPLLIDQGKQLTPDALSSLLTLAALFLLYEKKREYIAFPILFLSLFIRPDNMLLILLVSGFAIYRSYAYRGKINIPAIVLACLSIGSYFIISSLYHGYGWKITFMHSVIDINASPAYWTKIPLNVPLYFEYLFKGMALYKVKWMYSIFLFLLAYFSIRKSNHKQKAFLEMLLLLTLLLVFKFLTFPIFDDRYYLVQYLFVMLVLCITIFPRRSFANLTPNP